MVFQVKNNRSGVKQVEMTYQITFTKQGQRISIQLKAHSLAEVIKIIQALFNDCQPVTIVAA